MNTQISDYIAILGTIDAIDHATSAVTSDWVDTERYAFIAAYMNVGAITGTFDLALRQATDSSGTGSKAINDIEGNALAITQLSATDDNKQVIVNLDVGRLDIEGGFSFVAALVTPTGGSTNLASTFILGAGPRYAPVSGHDLATVAEIIDT